MSEDKTKTKNIKTVKSYEDLSVHELRTELQKVILDIRTGKERNTSLVKKIKLNIARKLTKK